MAELLAQLADAAARDDATAALQDKGTAAMPELLKALDNDDWQVRAGAAFALSMLGQDAQAAIPKLRDLAEALRDAGWNDANIEGFTFGNWRRLLGELLG